MVNLNYCGECKRLSYFDVECGYCKSNDIRDIKRKAPVNVIGTKIKGRVMNAKDGVVDILCMGEGNIKSIRQYDAENLRKIL